MFRPPLRRPWALPSGLAHESALQRVSVEANLRLAGSDQLKFLLKWPNDVLVRGQKLGGILLEAEAMADSGLAVVVGIGTNVVAAPEGTPTPATSLAALGVHIGAEELFAALSDAWVEFRGIWDNGRGFAEIRRLWLERAAGLGERVAIQTGTTVVEGTFDTIDETGCLIVRTADGKRVPITGGRGLFRRGGVGGSGLMARPDELTFAPLGGVGEIGMNLSIYGLGNRHQRSWLAVDLGVSFGDEEHLPGIDLIMPDIRFLEKERKNLMGLVLTHAHEDHFGAIIDLWPKLQCPIYATKFSAALFEAKCAAERNPPKIPVTVVPSGGRDRSRAVQRRVHSGRAFDSGIACAGDPHLGRHRAAHRRLEDRSDADHRPADRRAAPARTRRCRRAGAGRRFHQCGAGRALALGNRGRRHHHRSW